MHVQVNFVTRRRNGGLSKKSQVLDVIILNIGRGTDQDIILPDIQVTYEHAQIFEATDGTFYVSSKAISGIRVNQEPVGTKDLSPGDKIEVGSYEITIQKDNEEFDLIIDVEQIHTEDFANDELVSNARIDLHHNTRLNKRFWSWFLFVSILVVFLVLPLVASLFEPAKKILDNIPGAPGDSVWSSGKLASVHHHFKNNCKDCHQKPFIRVQDEACVKCHAKTHQHGDSTFGITKQLAEIKCALCHEEHNGSEHIIVKSDDLCANCHNELKELTGDETKLLNVSDFGLDHPEFRPSIPDYEKGKKILNRLSQLDGEKIKEQYTLIYNHKVHLKNEGVDKLFSVRDKNTSPEDQVLEEHDNTNSNTGDKVKLECSSCHEPDSGGVHMQSINYDRHCSSCHRLDFEKADKKRVVPHGTVSGVLFFLDNYYKSKALEGGVQDETAPDVVRQRRRPGKGITNKEKQIALDWATTKAKQVASEVFKYRTCKTCHTVTYNSDGFPNWTIAPIKIPRKWMKLADFNHEKHLTMKCSECHKVEKSEEGSDVLLPKIKVCRDCHGGGSETKRLASSCVDCHGFHTGDSLLSTNKKETNPQLSDNLLQRDLKATINQQGRK